MAQPFKLFRLQQIDSLYDRIQARLQEIETALNEDEALRQARQKVAEAQSALEIEHKGLNKAEQAVQEQRIKIEQSESTLYGGKVRNPKELQDLQNEVAALKRYRETLEDRQIECMLAVEEYEAVLDEAQAELERAQIDADLRHASLHAEQRKLLGDRERVADERQAAASTIPAEELDLYEQIRKQRRGIAVAKVSDRACAACGTMLNAALLDAARNPNQISRCSTCSRILYTG